MPAIKSTKKIVSKRTIKSKKVSSTIRRTKSTPLSSEHKILFMQNILHKMLLTKNNYDLRANFLLLGSSMIFIFSFIGILIPNAHGTIALLFIMMSSLGSSLLCLNAFRTPEIFRTLDDKISLLHHTAIAGMTEHEYARKLKDIMQNADMVIDTYIFEIYDITINSIRFKKKFIRWATSTLIIGLLVGLPLMLFLP